MRLFLVAALVLFVSMVFSYILIRKHTKIYHKKDVEIKDFNIQKEDVVYTVKDLLTEIGVDLN